MVCGGVWINKTLSEVRGGTMTEARVEQWFTVRRVAEIVALGESFLWREIGSGRLRSRKVGAARRVSESDLARWQSQFSENAQAPKS